MVIPNFLIIGAQKSGTTWLYRLLKQHPEIYMPLPKETEYFSYPSKHKVWGMADYSERYFKDVADEKAIGEATPSYMWNSDEYPEWCVRPRNFEERIPKIVKESLGSSIKLIAILRDPVDRAISAYFHHMNKGRIKLGQNILEAGKGHGIIHLGFYYAHLCKWLEHFNQSNFHIMVFEKSVGNPKLAVQSVFQFLGVDQTFIPKGMSEIVYKGMDRVKIGDQYYLPKSTSQNFSKLESDSDCIDLAIGTAEIDQLIEIYSQDCARLSNDLNIDISSWRYMKVFLNGV
jgi:hypothetical protein